MKKMPLLVRGMKNSPAELEVEIKNGELHFGSGQHGQEQDDDIG